MKPFPSLAQRRALTRAAERANGAIWPIAKVHGHAEASLIESLYRRGWAVDVLPSRMSVHFGVAVSMPIITAAGRAVIKDKT